MNYTIWPNFDNQQTSKSNCLVAIIWEIRIESMYFLTALRRSWLHFAGRDFFGDRIEQFLVWRHPWCRKMASSVEVEPYQFEPLDSDMEDRAHQDWGSDTSSDGGTDAQI